MSEAGLQAESEGARERRALRAAEALFKRVGFRAVTMEMVAREANIAKATLYSYFENKDALYAAVCARLARLLRGVVDEALARNGAPLDRRLAEAVIAKHGVVFKLVRSSPHAAELFSYKDAIAGEMFAELDAAILVSLMEAMRGDAQLARNAAQLSRALYLGSAELANRSATAAEMESEVGAFVAVHLAGARALSRKDKAR
jgi:AcrR family transcriptional regulator